MKLNIENLGQVFTPDEIVAEMIALIKNKGKILEPSSGNGQFVKKLQSEKPGSKVCAIEYDGQFKNEYDYLNIDFFSYSIDNKFQTIIGNPPYVKYQNIPKNTKVLLKKLDKDGLFNNRTNLYLFFIYKCLLQLERGGELIFITPKDFLKTSAAYNLNNFLYTKGTITDLIDLGDKKIFKTAQPNTIIWRFEKGNFSRKTLINKKKVKKFINNNGYLLFSNENYGIKLSDIAFVKVGAVSGADKIFEHKDGIDFVCSYTNKTGKTKKMLYNIKHKHLEKNKDVLINRKIRKFNDKNFYEWGRKYYESDKERIYVNTKTRNKKPFFISETKAYDGSILAIFPKKDLSKKELEIFCEELNNVNWEELGFVISGRYLFGQKSLENTLLPNNFSKYF